MRTLAHGNFLLNVTHPRVSRREQLPWLGAANRDPEVFEDPETFDIARSPNRHLAFSQGLHFCLGASLARMETRVALTRLFERYPNLRLAVPAENLDRSAMPGWHRLNALPVQLD